MTGMWRAGDHVSLTYLFVPGFTAHSSSTCSTHPSGIFSEVCLCLAVHIRVLFSDISDCGRAEKPILTTNEFPCDLDTTSIGLMTTHPAADVFTRVMNEMLQYRNEDDVVLVSPGTGSLFRPHHDSDER